MSALGFPVSSRPSQIIISTDASWPLANRKAPINDSMTPATALSLIPDYCLCALDVVGGTPRSFIKRDEHGKALLDNMI